jgi:hypothetical protein
MAASQQQNLDGIRAASEITAAAPGPSKLRTDPTVDLRNAPWVEKYRPRNLDEVAAHAGIINTSAASGMCALIHGKFNGNTRDAGMLVSSKYAAAVMNTRSDAMEPQ